MVLHNCHLERISKRIEAAGICLLLMGSVAGCGASSAENTAEITDNTISTAAPAQNLDYEVRTQMPSIFVDQVGYSTDSDKSVVFCAKDLPSEFEIRELDSGKTVFSGEIIKKNLLLQPC